MSVAAIETATAGIDGDTAERLATTLRPEEDAVAVLLLTRARALLSLLRTGA